MDSTEISPVLPSRRRYFLLAAGGIAATAGAGLGLWRHSDTGPADVTALWEMSFTTPAGQPLTMSSFRGKPLVVNFWATWCPPCVEELPLLDRFSRENSATGWQVVGLAIDQPSAVRKFLGSTPVSFPIGLAGLEGTDLGRALGNTTGGLPFTVVFTAAGKVLERKMGKVSQADLAGWSSKP